MHGFIFCLYGPANISHNKRIGAGKFKFFFGTIDVGGPSFACGFIWFMMLVGCPPARGAHGR